MYMFLKETIRPKGYNIFEKLFNKTINTYITEMGNTSKLYYSFFQKHIRPSGYTDTTFICNKLGEDLSSYNPQVKYKS